MSVATYSLITLEDYFEYAEILDADLLVDGIKVWCNVADATKATVAKDGATLTLIITGGADAGTEALTLTETANNTLTKLVAVIAGKSGWDAELCNLAYGSVDSQRLVDISATDALDDENPLTLQAYNFRKYEQMIDRASALIEARLGRNFKSRAYAHQRYSGHDHLLFLDEWPITAIDKISKGTLDCILVKNTSGEFNAHVVVSATGCTLNIDGAAGAENTFAAYTTMATMAAQINAQSGWEASVPDTEKEGWLSTLLYPHPHYQCLNQDEYLRCPDEPLEDWEWKEDEGIIFIYSSWASHFQDVFVTYTAGYAEIPGDIIETCCRLVKYFDSARTSGSDLMESEKLGDYQYKRRGEDGTIVDGILVSLRGYRRVKI